MNRLRLSTLALSTALLTGPVLAQTAPDAGQTLRDAAPAPLDLPRPGPALDLQAPDPASVPPGGGQVVVQRMVFTGHTRFSDDDLNAVIADALGQSLDLAGLQGLAARITRFYRDSGYPFAQVILAPQRMEDGTLTLTVVEGRYGAIETSGDADLMEGAQAFLSPLEPGAVIESASLERATLILDDQPGLRAAPIIRPGQDLGTGDLVIEVNREDRFTGDVGLDNHGNRYTGYTRSRANVQVNSPFLVGDQVSLRLLGTSEKMVLGSASYSLPLGGSGLRGQGGVIRTHYSLGREFSVLDTTGTATIYNAGLSYPLLRSQLANVTLGGVWQYKALMDRVGQTGSRDRKSSHTLPLSVQFDRRDDFGGGGITFGTLTWTPGQLRLDAGLRAADALTARSHGTFHKLTLDVARLQALPAGFSFYGRFSGQMASKNLDSSEGFSLGGPQGVRAYPVGEASGDEGWLGQVEVRYDLSPFTPYAFFDAGGVWTNAKPWQVGGQAGTDNTRSLSGGGLGLRASYEGWTLDGSLAWRTSGGPPQSDIRDRKPQVWLSVGYTF